MRLATRFTGNADDALDVLQETFAYFFRKFPGFVLSAKMTTFLYPVLRNLSIAARKKRSRERGEEHIRDPAADTRDPGNDRAELAIVLAALPDLDQAIALRPNYVNALMNRGDIYNYYYDIDYDKAVADYDRVLALDPEHTSVCGHRLLAQNHGWSLGVLAMIAVQGPAAGCQ